MHLNKMVKRKILLVTVGEQEKPLYEGIKAVSNVDKVYFLASSFTEKIANNIKGNIAKIYDTEVIKINEKEISDIINKIIEIHVYITP